MPKKTTKTRSKRSTKKSQFPQGKRVSRKEGSALMKKAQAEQMKRIVGPEAIVLDRVAKTFAYLQEERERSGDPVIEADSMLEHTDARGSIFNIIHEPIGAVALITSKPGTVRANHYHHEDAHLCYVVSGRIEYSERPVGSKEPAKKYSIGAGGAFYTGPQMEHAMYFPEQTTFITLGRLSRTPSEYEKDLTRLEGDDRLAVPDEMKENYKAPPATDVAETPTPPPAETTTAAPQEA